MWLPSCYYVILALNHKCSCARVYSFLIYFRGRFSFPRILLPPPQKACFLLNHRSVVWKLKSATPTQSRYALPWSARLLQISDWPTAGAKSAVLSPEQRRWAGSSQGHLAPPRRLELAALAKAAAGVSTPAGSCRCGLQEGVGEERLPLGAPPAR